MRKMSKTITEEEWKEIIDQWKPNRITLDGYESDSRGVNQEAGSEPRLFFGVQLPNGSIQAINTIRRDYNLSGKTYYNSNHERMIEPSKPDMSDIRKYAQMSSLPFEDCKVLLMSLKQEVIDSEHRAKIWLTGHWGPTIGDISRLVDIHTTEHDFGTLVAGSGDWDYAHNTKQKTETRDIKEMMI
tara:strand:+ start:159 stop:713 length:555 start_codon:yes stop_codon:yes gene_type:complete